MAKGFDSVKEAGRDIEERKNVAESGDFPTRTYFKLGAGESATVRFLEQGPEVQWAWVHEVDVPGETYPRKVVCRDQDEEGRRVGESCPGCEEDLPRKFRGVINLIHRSAGESGEDILATWIAGPRVFVDTLDPLDTTYKGLGSRDFLVTRKGKKLDTSYTILPADPDGGATALSSKDKKLAAEKSDLSYFVEPPAYEEWGKSQKKKKERPARSQESLERSPFRRRVESVA